MACDHTKHGHVNYCGDCGVDLTLRKEEVEARDKFFGIYKELLKKSNLWFDISLNMGAIS